MPWASDRVTDAPEFVRNTDARRTDAVRDASALVDRVLENTLRSSRLPTRIEPFYAALGRRIFQLRSKKGLTQAEVGGRLTVPLTRSAIANIETGKQRVLAHILVDIARALDIKLTDLVPEASEQSIEKSVQDKLLEFSVPQDVARALAATAKRPLVDGDTNERSVRQKQGGTASRNRGDS